MLNKKIHCTKNRYEVFLSIVVVCVVLCLVLCSSCSEKELSESERFQKMTQKLQDALDDAIVKYNGKGVSVAVLIPGQNMWTGVAGRSHGNTAITADMVFSAGSITKMFTAATILQLMQEGQLSLNDMLKKWLPDFEHIDNTITIKQLLNHTSGIYNLTEHPDIWVELIVNSGRLWTIEEIIKTYILPPLFNKGDFWYYSNTGYMLLRMLIREISSSTISQQYRNRFFIPLGMTNSTLVIDDKMPSNIAHGWYDIDFDGILEDLSQIPMTAFYSAAGGGVFCTAEELVI